MDKKNPKKYRVFRTNKRQKRLFKLALILLYVVISLSTFSYFIIFSGSQTATSSEITYIISVFAILLVLITNSIDIQNIFAGGIIFLVFGAFAYNIFGYPEVSPFWYFVIVICISSIIIIWSYLVKGRILNSLSTIFLISTLVAALLFVSGSFYSRLFAEDITIMGFLIVLGSLTIFVTLYSSKHIRNILFSDIAQYVLFTMALILLFAPLWPQVVVERVTVGAINFSYSYNPTVSTSNITISTTGIVPSILPECLEEGKNGTITTFLNSNYDEISTFVFYNYSEFQNALSNKWRYTNYFQDFSSYAVPVILNSTQGSFESNINDTCIYLAIITSGYSNINILSRQTYMKLVTIQNFNYSTVIVGNYLTKTNLPYSLYELYSKNYNYTNNLKMSNTTT